MIYNLYLSRMNAVDLRKKGGKTGFRIYHKLVGDGSNYFYDKQ